MNSSGNVRDWIDIYSIKIILNPYKDICIIKDYALSRVNAFIYDVK